MTLLCSADNFTEQERIIDGLIGKTPNSFIALKITSTE